MISSYSGLYHSEYTPYSVWGFASSVLMCAFFTIGLVLRVEANSSVRFGSDLRISISTYGCDIFLPLVLMFPSLFSICTDVGGDSREVVCFCH